MRRVEGLGGDLIACAQGQPISWRALSARAILDLDPSALEGLKAFPDEDAAFYRAAATWIGGDEDAAITILQMLPDLMEARELLRLIRQDRIEILSFFPEAGEYPFTLIDSAISDQKFRLRNVGFESGSLHHSLDADIRTLARCHQPELVLVGMIEWPALPRNIRALGCPVIGHTCDFDLHIQPVLPLLRQFDVILTAEKIKSSKLEMLVGSDRCVTYPEIWAVGVPSMPNNGPRPIDFVMTGTVLSDVHRDKESVLGNIISYSNLDYFLFNGTLPSKKFSVILEKSKLTLDYVRRPGMTTRAIQALSGGCCCLVRQDSLNQLFIPPDHGLLPTNFDDPADVMRKIRAVIHEEPERYRAAAQCGAEFVWKRFSTNRIGSRYLRFVTVMAAFVRAGGFAAVSSPQSSYNKRTASWRGWMPHNGHAETINAIRESNLKFIETAEVPEYRRANDEGRALICDQTLFAYRTRQPLSTHLTVAALNAFRRAMAAKRSAIVPAFNFIRTAFHFGSDQDKLEAEALAREIVGTAVERWEISFDDDLLPYDFFSAFCNQRRLAELLFTEASRPGSQRDNLVNTILASVYFYLGWRTEITGYFQRSIDLDSEFLDAKLEVLRSMIADGDGLNAILLLESLDKKYIFTAELPYLKFRASFLVGDKPVEPSEENFSMRLADFMNDYFSDFPTVARAVRRQFAEKDYTVWRRSSRRPRIAVLILDHHLQWEAKTAALDAEVSSFRDQFELIHTDVYARLDERALIWTDVVIRQFDPMAIVEHRGRVFMNAFQETSGDILFFAERMDRVTTKFLMQAADLLDHEASPLILADFLFAENGEQICKFIGIRRSDFIRLGGFDLTVAAQGSRGGVHEFFWRARNSGYRIMEYEPEGFTDIENPEQISLMPKSLHHVCRFLDLTVNADWSHKQRVAPIRQDSRLNDYFQEPAQTDGRL